LLLKRYAQYIFKYAKIRKKNRFRVYFFKEKLFFKTLIFNALKRFYAFLGKGVLQTPDGRRKL